MTPPRHYLNYAALCPTAPEAREAEERTLATLRRCGYSEAGLAWYRQTVHACRRAVAALLRADDPSTIAFTVNASAAHCAALSALHWKPGETLLTTTHENPSIMRQLRALEHEGVRLRVVNPISPEAVLDAIRAHMRRGNVKAIVMSHVSHVDGRIFPVRDVAALARAGGCLVIIDGAQAVGHIPVDLDALPCDLYFFTGHKWCEGPPGTGALVARDSFFRRPDLRVFPGAAPGAPPTSRFEIGTHNVGLIAGLAAACERRQPGMTTARQTALRNVARDALGGNPHFRIIEWRGPHAPGILTVTGPSDLDHGRLVARLESDHGIVVKLFADYPAGIAPAIRLSWSSGTPPRDVRKALAALRRLPAS